MKVAICRSAKAYLPDTDAYEAYLRTRGIAARSVDDRREIAPDEIAILFRFEDQFARDVKAQRRVHEEHNIPVGVRGSLRSALLAAGPKPDGQIRLEQADSSLPRPHCPTLVRPCGIDPALFEVAPRPDPEFDLVYCGSLDRPGVLPEIERLAALGFTIAAYGRVPPGAPEARMRAQGVRFFGRIGRSDLPAALANARAGLNFTPDRASWNQQESTKTLEYLAAGLPVVSNRYAWMDRFAEERGADILWLDRIAGPQDLPSASLERVDLSDRAWPTLLDRIGFIDFLGRVEAA